MKGGDFKITKKQFVPVLFDKYFDFQEGVKLENEDECKCNFYFLVYLKSVVLKITTLYITNKHL